MRKEGKVQCALTYVNVTDERWRKTEEHNEQVGEGEVAHEPIEDNVRSIDCDHRHGAVVMLTIIGGIVRIVATTDGACCIVIRGRRCHTGMPSSTFALEHVDNP